MSAADTVTIVGAGLTGALLAIHLARRGHRVQIFERNSDLRATRWRTGNSINLTLVNRGFASLEAAGVGEQVREMSVPAYGRRVHVDATRTEYQPYGNHDEALWSISRAALNCVLLNAAEKEPGVSIHFGYRCVGLDLDEPVARFATATSSNVEKVASNVVIGADGVRSAVRVELQRQHGFDFSQLYSSHSNKELAISPEAAARAGLGQNAIHIWPRGEFMLIAFPNPNGSYSATLHMPSSAGDVSFAAIRTPADVVNLFEREFPDALTLVSNLANDYLANPEIPMVTIRCRPWSRAGKVVLIGDAAHAVWPSYGQGANAGFEDCSVFDSCLAEHGNNWADVFSAFELRRRVHTNAIADLSEKHFEEIRGAIRDPAFLMRKAVERRLNVLFPDQYRSLYSRVAFTCEPYADAVVADARLRPVVERLMELPDLENQLESPEVTRVMMRWMKEALDQHSGGNA